MKIGGEVCVIGIRGRDAPEDETKTEKFPHFTKTESTTTGLVIFCLIDHF